MNVSGLCSRQTCPLANSNYATIKAHEEILDSLGQRLTLGQLYLYVKTIERAHTPSKLWEKIKLSRNYPTALAQIDTELEYWPEFLIHKNKQRLTKLTQMLIRTRRLVLKTQPELVGIKKNVERRERRREEKALMAARLETSIEKELLERLKKGVYGDGILNESQEAFTKALNELEVEQDDDQDVEFEEACGRQLISLDDEFDREFVSDVSEDEAEDEANLSEEPDSEDSQDDSDTDAKPAKKKTKRMMCYR
ncbi:ribosome biosynthesis protein [Kappamyces sp. JEL0680]|nr:ribosome biosynthesis protein [Kappamyces sp. JEL0680]